MLSTIEINQLESLPTDCLAILKDNLGPSDVFSLCLKTNNLDVPSLSFKITFVSIDKIPIYVLMVKSKHKVYKCLIGFNIHNEFESFKHLMQLESFNLFLFSNNKEQTIIKITNKNGKKFLDAMLSVKDTMPDVSCEALNQAKQKLLDIYSDDDLWSSSII